MIAIASCFYKYIEILRHHFESLTKKVLDWIIFRKICYFYLSLIICQKYPAKFIIQNGGVQIQLSFKEIYLPFQMRVVRYFYFLRRMVCYLKSYLGCNILHTHCISLSVCLSLPFSLSLSLSSSSCLLRWPLSYSYPLDAKVR